MMKEKSAAKARKNPAKGSSFCSQSAALAKYDAWTRYRYVEMLNNYVSHPATGKAGVVIAYLLAPFSDADCAGMVKALIDQADKLGLDVDKIKENCSRDDSPAAERLTDLSRVPRLEGALRNELKQSYRRKLAEVRRPHRSKSGLSGRILQAQRAFDLSDSEAALLLIAYMLEYDKLLERLIRESDGLNAGVRNACDKGLAIGIMAGVSRAGTRLALGRQGKLQTMALVDSCLEPELEVAQFLHGFSNKPLASSFFSEFTEKPIPLDRHFAVQDHVPVIRRLITGRKPDTPLHILLYGPPGAGKTEFCRSLACDLGLHVYEVAHCNTKENRDQDNFRYRAIWACANSVPRHEAIIVVDEADSMLNEPVGFFGVTVNESEKGMLNHLLDTVPATVVWITNHHDRIAESTRRRFDYALKFPALSETQRRFIWQELLAQHGLGGAFSDRELADFAAAYPLSIGSIERAVRNCRQMLADHGQEDTAPAVLAALLESQLKLYEETVGKKPAKPISTADIDLQGFHLRGEFSAAEVIFALQTFVHQDTPMADSSRGRMSLLLHGPPGTGKTEFAKFAAAQVDRRLIAKTASDLLNCYLGGTEKLIREAFEEAARENAVLFIDEADSFLQDRGAARRSWEVTQVNELLQQMERFRGILICATNFKARFDSAAMRRFSLKLQFDYLDPDGREFFYRRLVESLATADSPRDDMAAIRSVEYLTPGDFRVVRDQFQYLPQCRRTHAHLLEALRCEVRQKNGLPAQPIGFGR